MHIAPITWTSIHIKCTKEKLQKYQYCTLGWMGEIWPILDNGLLQDGPIMCWARNPHSNKCEATIKVTNGQDILSFSFFLLTYCPTLLEGTITFTCVPSIALIALLKKEADLWLATFEWTELNVGSLGAIISLASLVTQDKTWLNLRLTVSTRKRGARRCRASWTWPFVENLWLINY